MDALSNFIATMFDAFRPVTRRNIRQTTTERWLRDILAFMNTTRIYYFGLIRHGGETDLD